MKYEKIWYEDISVLIDKKKLIKYIPLKSYSKNEKLNAIMRFSLYLSIILSLISMNLNYMFIFIGMAIMTYIIDISSNMKEEIELEKKVENYSNIKKDKHVKKNNIKPKKYVKKCHMPNDHNPFMNFMVTDKRLRKPACKSHNNDEINDLVEDKFSIGLYKDINGIYNNENSQREFYTMPNTEAVNRQGELGRWLYHTPKTCKEGNGNQCVGNNMEKLNGESYKFI
jgi:hypothetical protein